MVIQIYYSLLMTTPTTHPKVSANMCTFLVSIWKKYPYGSHDDQRVKAKKASKAKNPGKESKLSKESGSNRIPEHASRASIAKHI
jgi:hypothetical protein